MIGRIGNGKRVDINFRARQFFAHPRQSTGPIAQEHRELGDGFNLDLRFLSHTDKMPFPGRDDNQKYHLVSASQPVFRSPTF
jgi:hypothetical protein